MTLISTCLSNNQGARGCTGLSKPLSKSWNGRKAYNKSKGIVSWSHRCNLRGYRPTLIENVGGEAHTFTPVAEFGGGFIPDLNGISGNPVPAPECLNIPALVFIPAGGTEEGPTAGSSDLPVGSHKFQCCIHPWMRTVIEVQAPAGKSAPASPSKGRAHHH
jgi:hypothetical protein